jgi:phosphatidylglycerophosphatase C
MDGTVVVDFDGVLVHGDSTVELLRHLVVRRPWLAPRLAAPVASFSVAGERSGGRTAAARRILATAFDGRSLAEVHEVLQEVGRHLATALGVASRDALVALEAHRADGDRVVVSSAGMGVLIEAFLAAHGLPDLTVQASVLAEQGGRVVLAHHNYGHAKLRTLRSAGHREVSTMYSDSLSDLPVLRAARVPTLVNPSRGLVTRAERSLGRAPQVVHWR